MNETKLETIRGLLNKAENAACPQPEAEALTAMAAKLMAKYGIEDAMLQASEPARRQPVTNRRVECAAPYAAEKAALLFNIVQAVGGRGVLLNDRAGNGRVLHVFGFGNDLDRAEMLWTSLLLQSVNAMVGAEYRGDADRAKAYGHVKAWRRSFLAGFNSEVIYRVKHAEQAARATAQDTRDATSPGGPSVALVVADRSREVASAFTGAYPRTTSSRSRLSGSGAGAGRAAGRTANIGGRAVNGGRAMIGA